MAFSLENFEYLAYTRQHELAAKELMSLLHELDKNYGFTGGDFTAKIVQTISSNELDTHVWTRMAAAISCLFADPGFQFTPEGFGQLFNWHRWFASIFSATPFRNADHIVRSMNSLGGDLTQVQLEPKNLLKFCLLYTPESEIPLSLDNLWESNKVLAVGLCMVLLSPRFLASPLAHQKREQILPWLTEKLPEISSINDLPSGILHDVYMHCSYADRPDKHDIKKSINVLIKRWLDQEGILALPAKPFDKSSKPVMLVIMEWFTSGHSIYRTHSRTLESARELFHVIGMGYPTVVDEAGKAVFDEFIDITGANIAEQLRQIRGVAEQHNAQVLYMPSVGMFQLTMYLANLRLAPVQAMALGHPATSHSPEMDYVVVEEDYVGDPACFSEKLLVLPKDGMPYRPSSSALDLNLDITIRENPEVVNIAIASTTMKLNPQFLATCAEITKAAKTKVHFHFLIGQAQGLVYPHVKRVIQQVLGDYATIYPHQNYAEYMKVIASADMFINPFPFGNTNGIIDAVTAGIVGVNKTGREVHEHIDEGLFGRLKFPKWLTTKTNEEYIAAAVKLIDDPEERTKLRKKLTGVKKVQLIFKGRPEIMGQMFFDKVKNHKDLI